MDESTLFGGVASALGKRQLQKRLPQNRTNGKSKLGTLLAPVLPFFLGTSRHAVGAPWAALTEVNTNPYTDYPTTNVTRTYDFTISRGVLAPDGYERPAILVNGAFPGPMIEANWGDMIVVTVHNNITGPDEGTAMHWHGFLQKDTPAMDGVPGGTHCPIPPGKSFTYEFQATLYGTSWYHSHYSAQYNDGILGPIVIYGPQSQVDYDIDIGPVMVSDWSHKDYFTIVKKALEPGGSPVIFSDNTLINGKMNFDCSTVAPGDNAPCHDHAGISKFKFTTGKTHRLRLINCGADGVHRFSIDGHTLTVIAQDFIPVQPYNTTVVTLGVGQRTDVLVTANAGDAKSVYWMRTNQTACTPTNQPLGVAAVYYDQADTNAIPTSTAWSNPDPGTCTNDELGVTEPMFKMPVPEPSFTKEFVIEMFKNETGSVVWKFDDVSCHVDYNAPPLLLAHAGNFSYPEQWNVKNFGTNSSVRLIVQNHSPGPHPIHLHGFNVYVLHEGFGRWDGQTIINPENPQRRDVVLVRSGGHLVLQFDLDNPGVWPFHCHIAWHASAGFFSQLVVLPDQIQQLSIPDSVYQTCRDWGTWTQTNIPDQIDSGV